MKIMPVGAIRDMNSESWYARLIIFWQRRLRPSHAALIASTIDGAHCAGGSALMGSVRTVTPRRAATLSHARAMSASRVSRRV